MKQRARIYYTETDKALMWDRWQNGESLHSIARLFARHHSAIQGILTRTGGIRPPQRQRSQRALTLNSVFAIVVFLRVCQPQLPKGAVLERGHC